MSNILMSHQVAGYPDDETCLAVGEALIAGGAKILEVQLAFSDPSADGVAIQTACSTVLARKYTVKQGMAYMAEMHRRHPEIQIFIMTYAALVYRPGVENFVKMAVESGVTGLIVPDLPFDCDEGLTVACRKYGIHNIPVAAPSMTDERLKQMTDQKFEYIYTALRSGITGGKTVVTKEMLDFIDKTSAGGAKILGGFGITDGEQAKLIAPHVYAIVAGSVFVNIIRENYNAENPKASMPVIQEKITAKAKELCC